MTTKSGSARSTVLDMLIGQVLASAKNESDLKLSPTSVGLLVAKIIPILKAEPSLLELRAPINVVSDIHGQLSDLLRVFTFAGMPPESSYLFLGDYVDRGQESLEVICLLFALKVRYPDRIYLLRGNHETVSQSEVGGFLGECIRKVNRSSWEKICDAFNYLPFAATINNQIFCVHAGISPKLQSLSAIKQIKRPTDIPLKGLLTDLVWSDPCPDTPLWGPSPRGETCTWGVQAVRKFLASTNMRAIIRGHQTAVNGFHYPFSEFRSVLTLYSATKTTYPNPTKAAIAVIDDECGLKVHQIHQVVPDFVLVSGKVPLDQGSSATKKSVQQQNSASDLLGGKSVPLDGSGDRKVSSTPPEKGTKASQGPRSISSVNAYI